MVLCYSSFKMSIKMLILLLVKILVSRHGPFNYKSRCVPFKNLLATSGEAMHFEWKQKQIDG